MWMKERGRSAKGPVLFVGLVVVLLLGSCNVDPSEMLRQRLDQAFSGMTNAVDQLDGAVDEQRVKLGQQTASIVQTATLNLQGLVEQERQAVDALKATGTNLSETATADLEATMKSIASLSDQLTAAVQKTSNDTIAHLADEIDRQRDITLQQIRATVQSVIRPTIAQLQKTGDEYVGQVENTGSTLIARIISGAIVLVAVIALVITLLRTRTPVTRAVLVATTGVLALAGTTGFAFAKRFSSHAIKVPDGQVLCNKMLADAKGLTTAAATRSAAPQGIMRASALREAVAKASTASGSQPDDARSVAATVLDDANQCLTYAQTAQMADLAAQDFTLALAVLSDAVTCHAMSDCAVIGKGCDLQLGMCEPWGLLCDDQHPCSPAESKTCEHDHCIAIDHKPCTDASSCPGPFACDSQLGYCVAASTVDGQHQKCTLPAPAFGPCASGERQVVNHLVTCVETVHPTPEVCNGIDDDCNGTVDDGLHTGDHCIAAATGECANGTSTCTNGHVECVAGQPQAEACDGKDNDCNGAIDDLQSPSKGACAASAAGECANGEMLCRGGTWQCIAGTAHAEACDGLDNNCNGLVDEAPACPEESVFSTNDERHWFTGLREEHTYGDSCGTDEAGRQRHRTQCIAADAVTRPESHCEPFDSGFGPGWVSADDTDCRCKVHFGSRGDAHVRCGINIQARGIGRPHD